MLPNSTERAVTISGSSEAITQCVYHICLVMSEVKNNSPSGNHTHRERSVHYINSQVCSTTQHNSYCIVITIFSSLFDPYMVAFQSPPKGITVPYRPLKPVQGVAGVGNPQGAAVGQNHGHAAGGNPAAVAAAAAAAAAFLPNSGGGTGGHQPALNPAALVPVSASQVRNRSLLNISVPTERCSSHNPFPAQFYLYLDRVVVVSVVVFSAFFVFFFIIYGSVTSAPNSILFLLTSTSRHGWERGGSGR